MKVLMSGPPGAGKGTQGSRIAQQLAVPHVASGDLVRDHVQRGTPEGQAARQASARGDLVDDDVLLQMIAPTLEQAARSGGFVLDGYPRTLAQARHVEQTPATLDVVVHLVVPRDELLRRLLERGRADDTPDIIAHRLEVYEAQTAPLVTTYSDEGRLVMVDGAGTVDEVDERIVRDLQVWRLRRPLVV